MDRNAYFEQDARLSWLSEEALEILNACFDARAELIPAGESRESAGCIGYLLRGSGMLRRGDIEEPAAAGTLFGVVRGGERGHLPAAETLTAAEPCAVFWIACDVLDFACHRSCWFHTCLMLVFEELLKERQKKDAV